MEKVIFLHIFGFLFLTRGVGTSSVAVALFNDLSVKLVDLNLSFNTNINSIHERLNKIEGAIGIGEKNVDSDGDPVKAELDVGQTVYSDIIKTKERFMKALESEKRYMRKLLKENEEKFNIFKHDIMNTVSTISLTVQELNKTLVTGTDQSEIVADILTIQNRVATIENYQKITCRYIEPPENGYIKDITYEVGTFVVFGCNEGFKLKGLSQILCGVDGEWRSQNRPICQPVMCPTLYDIPHGQIFQDSSDGVRDNYESVAEYTCKRGFRIFGTELEYRRTCQLNGKWSGPEPYCEAPTCDEIGPFPGGRVVYPGGNRIEHSFAFYLCDDGFTRYPERTKNSKCTEMSGKFVWSPKPPVCYQKLSVVVPANCSTRSSGNEITHLQSYNLYPKSGYEFYSSEDYLKVNFVKITNTKGEFDPHLPKCVPERCATWELAETDVYYKNNTRAIGNIDSHVNYSFACTSKYEFAGRRGTLNLIRRCEFGRFINVPKCVPKQCVINNIQLKSNKIRIEHNRQVKVMCKSDRLELFSNASWAYKEPFYAQCSFGEFNKPANSLTCVPKRCNTESLKNMIVSDLNGEQAFGYVDSNYTYTVKCIVGYELKADRYLDKTSVERSCEFGDFINVPKCVEKRCAWTNKDIELVYNNNSPVKSEKVSHDRQIRVQCPADRPQLFNAASGNYIQNIRTKCQHGDFIKDLNSLACVPKPCDTAVLAHMHVYLANGTQVKGRLEGGVTYKLTCEGEYTFQDFPDQYKESPCIDGEFQNVDKCIGKPCTLLYADDNIKITPDINGQIISNGSVVPHNTQVSVTCKSDYELYDQDQFRKEHVAVVNCNFGHMDTLPTCAEKRCRIDGSVDGHCYHRRMANVLCLTKEFSIRSTKSIYLQCNDKYSLTPLDDNGSLHADDNGSMLCTRGTISPRYQCDPDPCTIPEFSNASKNITSNSIRSGETIMLMCVGRHHISGTINDKQWTGRCITGTIKNIPTGCVPDNCVNPNEANGQLKLVSSQETLADVIPHGAQIQLVCDHGFDAVSSKNEISNNTEPQIQCDRGKLLDHHQCKRCRNGRFPEVGDNSTVNAGLDKSTPGPSSKNMTCDEYRIKLNTDCTLLERSMYNYTDSNGIDIILPHTVNEGANVTVQCKYPAVDDYYYFDYFSAGENETIICKNGTFPEVSLNCKNSSEQPAEAASHPCDQFVLRYGKVTNNELGEYHVFCNIGYTLNLPHEGRDRPCKCSGNELICFAGRKPMCEADTCDIPLNMDHRLTLYQLPNHVYLSAGDQIQHASFVFFNCSDVSVQEYEPANRRFRCVLGKWRGEDRNPNWDFGNNGTFPTCRKATCEPPCENSGVCFRDGECRCQHMTKGDRCQIPLCDDQCAINGGTCLQPGKCGNCPDNRYGDNCELENTCKLPHNAARYHTNREVFAARETIRKVDMRCDSGQVMSSEFMTCQQNRTWTNIIKCLNINFKYVVRIQVADWFHAGTDDTVSVRIDGHDESTKVFTMKGDFWRNKLVENEFRGIDVGQIRRVVVEKSKGSWQDNVGIVYASIYIDVTDDFYVFTKQGKSFWLEANVPTPLYMSGRPERCVHTYGNALNRTPKQRRTEALHVSLRECKQRCVTTLSMTCNSIHFIPDPNKRGFGWCFHYTDSPDSNKFRDNSQYESKLRYVSYKRTCRQS